MHGSFYLKVALFDVQSQDLGVLRLIRVELGSRRCGTKFRLHRHSEMSHFPIHLFKSESPYCELFWSFSVIHEFECS
jgi:hypothetical protein